MVSTAHNQATLIEGELARLDDGIDQLEHGPLGPGERWALWHLRKRKGELMLRRTLADLERGEAAPC